ncbi:MAG: hypothetical protein ABT940_00230 [Alphaproteobacteria bacterium]
MSTISLTSSQNIASYAAAQNMVQPSPRDGVLASPRDGVLAPRAELTGRAGASASDSPLRALPEEGAPVGVRDVVTLSSAAIGQLLRQGNGGVAASLGAESGQIRAQDIRGHVEARYAAAREGADATPAKVVPAPAVNLTLSSAARSFLNQNAEGSSDGKSADVGAAVREPFTVSPVLEGFHAQEEDRAKSSTGIVNIVTGGVSSQQISFLV